MRQRWSRRSGTGDAFLRAVAAESLLLPKQVTDIGVSTPQVHNAKDGRIWLCHVQSLLHDPDVTLTGGRKKLRKRQSIGLDFFVIFFVKTWKLNLFS